MAAVSNLSTGSINPSLSTQGQQNSTLCRTTRTPPPSNNTHSSLPPQAASVAGPMPQLSTCTCNQYNSGERLPDIQ